MAVRRGADVEVVSGELRVFIKDGARIHHQVRSCLVMVEDDQVKYWRFSLSAIKGILNFDTSQQDLCHAYVAIDAAGSTDLLSVLDPRQFCHFDVNHRAWLKVRGLLYLTGPDDKVDEFVAGLVTK